MNAKRIYFSLLLFGLLLSACTPANGTSPTSTPVSPITQIPPTQTSLSATATFTAVPPTETPTLEPTATASPIPTYAILRGTVNVDKVSCRYGPGVLGKKTFAEHCAVCHGDDARGMIGPDLTRRDFKYGKSKASLTETISNGRPGGMPAFGNRISREKIEWLAQYILSL